MLKKALAILGLTLGLHSTFLFEPASAQQEWYGEPDWQYLTVCLDTPSNARLNPGFQEGNIRAVLVGGTCGNVIFDENERPVVENNFVLLEFYFEHLNGYRRYWVHVSQIKEIY